MKTPSTIGLNSGNTFLLIWLEFGLPENGLKSKEKDWAMEFSTMYSFSRSMCKAHFKAVMLRKYAKIAVVNRSAAI